MEDNEIHYLLYDEEEIWDTMIDAYINAGGDVLYPGDEKEMLLRGVEQIIMQSFATIDNALRMDTLRYAVRDYLDIYGEKRDCYRITAEAAKATVRLTFLASGESKVIEAGTSLTADGAVLYTLNEDVTQTGFAGTVDAEIICSQEGSIGNGLLAGTEMQFLTPEDGVSNVTVLTTAAGGRDKEDDETYRERIRTYGLASVTTGPEEQYRNAAMAVSTEIIDAAPVNGGAGVVNVYLLLANESGAAALIAAVEDALTPKDVRPLTDDVHVSLAAKKEYTINIEYLSDGYTDVESNIAEAVAEYQNWQDRTVGRAFNPDRLKALLYQAGCTMVTYGEGSEFDGGTVEYTEIDEDEYCKGTITWAVMET